MIPTDKIIMKLKVDFIQLFSYKYQNNHFPLHGDAAAPIINYSVSLQCNFKNCGNEFHPYSELITTSDIHNEVFNKISFKRLLARTNMFFSI